MPRHFPIHATFIILLLICTSCCHPGYNTIFCRHTHDTEPGHVATFNIADNMSYSNAWYTVVDAISANGFHMKTMDKRSGTIITERNSARVDGYFLEYVVRIKFAHDNRRILAVIDPGSALAVPSVKGLIKTLHGQFE